MTNAVFQRPKGTTIHRKDGKSYLFKVESYWDKEKKAPRNRQFCLGRIDEETGVLTPSNKKARTAQRAAVAPGVTATSKVYGPYLLLSNLSKDIGLTRVIRQSFSDVSDELLSLAFFLAQKGDALSLSEAWSQSHKHPFDKPIASQRVSEILRRIGENDRQRFLSLWLKQLSEKEMMCFDTTSISSYASANEYLKPGRHRNNEPKKLPQVNLAMLFGQESGLPAYYRELPGNINDVISLKTTIDSLDFLDKPSLYFVLDRGFYSESNVDALFANRYRFVLGVPSGRVWVRNILDQYQNGIHLPKYRQITGKNESLFMVSHRFQWGNRRAYLHLYHSASKAAEDYDKLLTRLAQCKVELETEDRKDYNAEYYDRYFIIKRTPKRGLSVKYNDDEITKYRNQYAGFFCIMTNMKMSSLDVLELYRKKDIVEKSFDDLKNTLDMKRLRIHSSEAMKSRLFIQFLALILLSAIRIRAKKVKELQYKSAREIIVAMETITLITYSGRYGRIITEAGPQQKTIAEAFGVKLEA